MLRVALLRVVCFCIPLYSTGVFPIQHSASGEETTMGTNRPEQAGRDDAPNEAAPVMAGTGKVQEDRQQLQEKIEADRPDSGKQAGPPATNAALGRRAL